MSWLNDLQEKHFPGHPETIKGIEEILVLNLHWQNHLDEVPGEKYLGTIDYEFKVKKDSSLPLNMKISSSVFFEGNNFQVAYEMEPNKYFPHGKVFPRHELVVKNKEDFLISLFSMMSEDFKKIEEEASSL